MARIRDHERAYETIETNSGPFVKIYNGSFLIFSFLDVVLENHI